ncbi:MAG: SDR family NAD(P)-dependent oxidoreductase [Candidatus Nitrosopolaris sp.]
MSPRGTIHNEDAVFITGRRQDELNKAVNQIGKSNVTAVQSDVSNLADLDRLYETVKQQKGRIDVLFANAGLWELRPLEAITEEHFDKIFSINVKGLLFTVQKALPLFQDGGSIILTGAGSASKGFAAFNVYSASKAAVRSFARTVDLKHRKIRVNAISPGPISILLHDLNLDRSKSMNRKLGACLSIQCVPFYNHTKVIKTSLHSFHALT